MGFAVSPLHAVWDYQTLERKLRDLADKGNFFNRNCYIKTDLSVGYFDRTSLPFRVGRFFHLTDYIHDIDYVKTKKVLLELKPQIERTNNKELIFTFKQALLTFNDKAPKHLVVEDIDAQLGKEPVKETGVFLQTAGGGAAAYVSPTQRKDPPVLARLPFEFFSNEFLTKPDVLKRDGEGNLLPAQLVKRYEIAEAYGYAKIAEIKDFEKVFDKYLYNSFQHLDVSSGVWNVHDIYFQDLALRLTSSLSDQELRNPKTKGLKHLIRARNFAIGSRSNISWVGRPIKSIVEQQAKQKEMEANWQSIVLRDWGGVSETFKPCKAADNFPQKITVTKEDTQTTVERLAKSYPSEKICWVNKSDAHKVCGSYQNMGVKQDEDVTTHSDAIVVLSNLGKVNEYGEVIFRDRLHIPPGGNYFHKVRFITGDQVLCNSIVHPFADFRNLDFGEGQDYVDAQGKLAINTDAYKKRIKVDMRGVLCTAVEEGQHVLILGATGCGMCGHDPLVEAQAWKEVLAENQFAGRFKEVVFAIVDEPNKPSLVKAFEAAIL